MSSKITRRHTLKLLGSSLVAGSVVGCQSTAIPKAAANTEKTHTVKPLKDNWGNTHDRIWIGKEYWANPMEDWEIKDGGVEVNSFGGSRSVHSLTHQLTNPVEGFDVSVVVHRVEKTKKDGGGGIRLGARSDVNDYRSNCFIERGYDAGILGQELVLGRARTRLKENVDNKDVLLKLNGQQVAGAMTLKLEAFLKESGESIGKLTDITSNDKIKGNIGVISNFNIKSTWGPAPNAEGRGARYRFTNFELNGGAFSANEDQRFGPILWSMYTLNNTRTSEGYVLKLSVLTGPMGEQDNQQVELQVKDGDKWVSYGNAPLDPLGWVATFRIPNWDQDSEREFRAVYFEKHKDGTETPDIWTGLIRSEPKGKKLNMAAFTCQNDYAFPYAPLEKNVRTLDPDIVYFSGDQLYESHGGFGIVRAPENKAILNYLRKYYQFGWAFREIMKDRPTICIPDDHDVLQGNLWGEGGAMMKNPEKDPSASITPGYIQTPAFINTVHKTHASHHPEAYNASPDEAVNGVTAYFGDMVYANVSFAILSDRQFKSGPDRVGAIHGATGHDEDPLFINKDLDKEGLQLLGPTQETFLKDWSKDWNDHALKAVLSQTIFANINTHNGRINRYMKYDFDGCGWPVSGRNRAVDIMRDAMALHIAGDTHLATLSQYGLDKQRDSSWVFAVPAIGAGWQRFWFPEKVGIPLTNIPQHGLPDTGECLDSFGSLNYVYAVANPVKPKGRNRYVRAQEKGSGFGMIEFNTEALTYECTAYRFLADVTDPKADNVYAGWPVTIQQKENKGDNVVS
ncbi:alkaline phosphatase D family protein [Vibrio sp. 10N.286.49.F3]|uniref:alkaline phosphatase D family protein n=1 Tax=unclassified Vibrio TaxID=2614977 RepID=UPI003551E939